MGGNAGRGGGSRGLGAVTAALVAAAAIVCLAAALVASGTGRSPVSRPSSAAVRSVRPLSFAGAVGRLVRAGYPRSVVAHLTGLGDAAGGFRLAGGGADLAQSRYVAAEMRDAGLSNVRLEPFPVDVWNVRGAEVVCGGEHFVASQWAGVPGTAEDGITAPLVYVHSGLAADYRAAGDVTGRLVLVDFRPSDFWVGVVGMEAAAHGAAGMVLTSTRRDMAVFAGADSLASSSATYSTDAVPFVYVCRRDGDRLRRLAAVAASATMRSDVAVTTAARGGLAYNVVGELPGTASADDALVIGAHQDAFFRGAVDDASGVAGLLTMARAMRLSGYRPERTIRFVSHSAEEFGAADSPYDWCIGSWRLVEAHPDWAGHVSAELELDEIGYRRGPLWALNVPELGAYLRRVDRPGARLWPQGWITSYSDQWAYAARGIPSVHFGNTSDAYDAAVNHTDRDVATLIDFSTLVEDVTTVFRAVRGLAVVSSRLLPFAPSARVRELAASASAAELRRSGCDAAVVRRYERAVARLSRAAAAYGARARAIPAARTATVNAALVVVERDLNRSLAALDWCDAATYPHRAQLDDLNALNEAVRRCRARQRGAALAALLRVAHTATGRHLSAGVYRRFLERFAPANERLNWAAWARLPLPLDVMPEYRLIKQGRCRAALPGLVARRLEARRELERRLGVMGQELRGVAAGLEALR